MNQRSSESGGEGGDGKGREKNQDMEAKRKSWNNTQDLIWRCLGHVERTVFTASIVVIVVIGERHLWSKEMRAGVEPISSQLEDEEEAKASPPTSDREGPAHPCTFTCSHHHDYSPGMESYGDFGYRLHDAGAAREAAFPASDCLEIPGAKGSVIVGRMRTSTLSTLHHPLTRVVCPLDQQLLPLLLHANLKSQSQTYRQL